MRVFTIFLCIDIDIYFCLVFSADASVCVVVVVRLFPLLFICRLAIVSFRLNVVYSNFEFSIGIELYDKNKSQANFVLKLQTLCARKNYFFFFEDFFQVRNGDL